MSFDVLFVSMQRILTLFMLVGMWCTISAQGEVSQWHFGNGCVLDFSSGSPVASSGAQASLIGANEGTAVACDANGNLLFYSNGYQVWNRQQAFMPSFANWPPSPIGIPLLGGGPSATHSAAAVQRPGSTTEYYLFGMAEEIGFNGYSQQLGISGLSYVMIDMSLDNGLGDVVGGIQVVNTFMTEKMALTRHCNGRDTWLVCHEHNSNRFFSYLITPSGIDPPVISEAGFVHDCPIGQMKINVQGNRIACVTYGFFSLVNESTAEVLTFDNSSGQIGESLFLDSTLPINPQDNASGTYGVAFSPDGSKLYATLVNEFSQGLPSQLYQYNLTLPTNEIVSQRELIAEVEGYLSGLQIGPDCKIYAGYGSNRLGVINNPNAAGSACGWNDSGVVFPEEAYTGLSFPTFDDSFFRTACAPTITELEVQIETQCVGEPSLFQWVFPVAAENIEWEIEQNEAIVFTAEGEVFDYTFTTAGSYVLIVSVSVDCSTLRDTLEFEITSEAAPTINLIYPDQVCVEDLPITPQIGEGHTTGGSFFSTTASLGSSSGAISAAAVGDSVIVRYRLAAQACSPAAEAVYSIFIEQCDTLREAFVDEDCQWFAPNAFSPNNDGLNDVFNVEGCVADEAELLVFNRNGELIFRGNAKEAGWQGNVREGEYFAQDGVYAWQLMSRENGLAARGHVVLLR